MEYTIKITLSKVKKKKKTKDKIIIRFKKQYLKSINDLSNGFIKVATELGFKITRVEI